VSTILKALRRLEEQRTQGEGRPLREEVAAGPRGPESPRRRRRWLGWAAASVVAAVLGVAGGLALWRWTGGETATPMDVAAQPVPAAQHAPDAALAEAVREARAKSRVPAGRPQRVNPQRAAAPPTAAAAAPPAPVPAPPDPRGDQAAGLPDHAFASPVEVVPRPPAEPRRPLKIARAADPLPGPEAMETPPAAPPAPVPAPVPASKPAPAPAVAKPVVAPAPRQIAAAEPEPAPQPKPAVAAEPESVPPKPVVDAEPEEITARASEPRAAAPAPGPGASSVEPRPEVAAVAPGPANLVVAKTLWHPQADRRVAFVSVDGAAPRRIQEGDVVGRYVVSEIQPSGVVFLDDGQKVRRAVGAK
jgi:hypothetical protein